MRGPGRIYPRMTAESQAYCRMKSEIAARHARKSEEAFANQLVEEADATRKTAECAAK